MAYRDPTFNANILTDLLGTYLTHNSQEREKYYKAEQQANKPQYKTVDGSVLQIKPLEIYNEKTGRMEYVSQSDAIGKASKQPVTSFKNQAIDFITGFKNKYPNIDVSNLEKNIGDVDTKEEYTFLRGELGKKESRTVSNTKSGRIAMARNTIKGNEPIYSKLGSDLAILDNKNNKKLDLQARKREKKALQNTMNAYGINKKVYLKEDLPKLKEEYLKLIPKNPNTESNILKIKEMNADELFNEIERIEEKHGIDLPFWLHRERYKGFNEFENLLNSMENVTK